MSGATVPGSLSRRDQGVLVLAWLLPVVLLTVWMPGETLLAALPGLVASLWLLRQANRRNTALLGNLQDAERRRDVAEAGLRKAQHSEAVSWLARGIAHDLNNHLTAISSNVELLALRLPTDAVPQQRLAQGAISGVQRAARLTHELLAFSRPQPVEPEPIDPGRLLAGMADVLRRVLGESVVAELVPADGLALAWGDARQLELAVLQLAVALRDALPDGGRVRIETANVTVDGMEDVPAGAYVSVALRGSGPGMLRPAFDVGRLAHCGTLRIGQGAAATLLLPRHQPRPERGAAVAAGPACGLGTILVVEDDSSVRRGAAEALRSLGYNVLEAPDAMEGFRLIVDRGDIDLLFTDLGLPGGVDGRALADAARNHSPGLRVLFTTGYAGAVPVPDQPGVLFIAKPFSIEQLAAKVREMLCPAGVLAAEPADGAAG